ncbi:MAG: hypothetical protein R3343_06825 [Nitriliruptorales bacterium]|nr:hypothetical protein [Nitriliruptorales bacterium]
MTEDNDLQELAEPVRERFAERHEARETAYVASRDVIRSAANAIRALHRGERDRAEELMTRSGERLAAAAGVAHPHPHVFYGGFLQDAMKEYAEARITAAVLDGADVPSPADLDVDDASWLHGLSETVGECRRACLDAIRSGDLERGEQLLGVMQEIMSVLVAIDVPDGLTRGLRRKADGARAITERTRGDLTTAVGQRELRGALDAHREALERSLDTG